MLYLKTLYQSVLAVLLFLTFSGFSEVSTYDSTFKNPQTEVVVSNSIQDHATAKFCNAKNYITRQVTVNHYTVFNFKSLLNWYQLNFSVTLKTQKQRTFQFLDTNNILKQNLVAYKYTTPIQTSFVK